MTDTWGRTHEHWGSFCNIRKRWNQWRLNSSSGEKADWRTSASENTEDGRESTNEWSNKNRKWKIIVKQLVLPPVHDDRFLPHSPFSFPPHHHHTKFNSWQDFSFIQFNWFAKTIFINCQKFQADKRYFIKCIFPSVRNTLLMTSEWRTLSLNWILLILYMRCQPAAT